MVRFKSCPRWLGVNKLRGTTGIIGLGSGFTGASAMPVLLALPVLPALLVGGVRVATLAFSILRSAALLQSGLGSSSRPVRICRIAYMVRE